MHRPWPRTRLARPCLHSSTSNRLFLHRAVWPCTQQLAARKSGKLAPLAASRDPCTSHTTFDTVTTFQTWSLTVPQPLAPFLARPCNCACPDKTSGPARTQHPGLAFTAPSLCSVQTHSCPPSPPHARTSRAYSLYSRSYMYLTGAHLGETAAPKPARWIVPLLVLHLLVASVTATQRAASTKTVSLHPSRNTV